MAEQQVYKTTVSISIGFSICAPSGDWSKENISISSEIGPGYPTVETMEFVVKQQQADAMKAANEQIEAIAAKIVEKVQRR